MKNEMIVTVNGKEEMRAVDCYVESVNFSCKTGLRKGQFMFGVRKPIPVLLPGERYFQTIEGRTIIINEAE